MKIKIIKKLPATYHSAFVTDKLTEANKIANKIKECEPVIFDYGKRPVPLMYGGFVKYAVLVPGKMLKKLDSLGDYWE